MLQLTKTLSIKSDGTPSGTIVRLSDGTSLGLIQSLRYEIGVGGRGKLTIETELDAIEVAALRGDVDIVVNVNPPRVFNTQYVLDEGCHVTRSVHPPGPTFT